MTIIVPPDKLDILWQIFNKFDRSRSGNMVGANSLQALYSFFSRIYFSSQPLDDLFDRVIIYPRSELTDSLLGLIGHSFDILLFDSFLRFL